MGEEPRSDQIIDICGPEAETLFWHAKSWLVAGSTNAIQSYMDETWAYYRDVADDRLLALVSALCIENAIDALLEAIGPGFGQYRDDLEIRLSVKIKMARALQLLPSKVLNACDLARGIRNDFAHHLDYKQFGDLGEKRLRQLAPCVAAFNTATRAPGDSQKLFKDLVGFVLLALRVYTEQVAQLRKYLATAAFRESFKKWAEGTQLPPQRS